MNDAVIVLWDGAVIGPTGFQFKEQEGVAAELTVKVSEHVFVFPAEFLNVMSQVSDPAELKVKGPAEPLITDMSVSANGIGPLQEIRPELAFSELQYSVELSPVLMDEGEKYA